MQETSGQGGRSMRQACTGALAQYAETDGETFAKPGRRMQRVCIGNGSTRGSWQKRMSLHFLANKQVKKSRGSFGAAQRQRAHKETSSIV
jgi:hypothetical protein